MKNYNKENISLAKALRKNMTRWERKLWYDFLRDYPVRFQRQKAIGNYIADFYSARARLVIELDGGGHYTAEQAGKDEVRTKNLESMNLTVVRLVIWILTAIFVVYANILIGRSRVSPSVSFADSSLIRGSLGYNT